jgi:hypothetical protein
VAAGRRSFTGRSGTWARGQPEYAAALVACKTVADLARLGSQKAEKEETFIDWVNRRCNFQFLRARTFIFPAKNGGNLLILKLMNFHQIR